jgi:xylulokinase
MTSVLGIDIGTQSVKAVVYDAEAKECVEAAAAPLDLYQTSAGVAEQLSEWWVTALQEALEQIDPQVRQRICAIGVSGQQHGFVPLGESGEVLAPIKLWCDTSTAFECEAIMTEFGGSDRCIEEIGNPLLPGYTASKVRWLKEAHPDLYDRMTCILLPHDYINYYLTGERCMEAGDASGTGFLDVRSRQWSQKMLQVVDSSRDLRECLPEVELENVAIGGLLPRVAKELGLAPDIPVSIGGGDNMMAAIATGNVEPGIVTMSLGTSGTVYGYSGEVVVDPVGEFAAFCSSTGGWLPLVCTMNCTVATELLRDLFKLDLSGFEASLMAAKPGAGGVITVPYFNGERTPNLPAARACMLGMDSDNTRPENILRSAVEGVTFGLRHGLSRLQEEGVQAEKIVLSGGGANSPTWRQMVADVCNVAVLMYRQEEGAAFGAAIQALEIVSDSGLSEILQEHLYEDLERCCLPGGEAAGFYDDAFQEYQRAAEQVAGYYGN